MVTKDKGTGHKSTSPHWTGARRAWVFALVSVLIMTAALVQVFADPNGATITYNSTGSRLSTAGDARTDPRGTITIVTLDAIQQDQHWKGYVGNVTGVLTLDDADGFTIYDWDLTGMTISGEVYATRASSPNWTSVQCANLGNISVEETFHNMSGPEADSINNTFNDTLHDGFWVGEDQIIQDNCPSAATFVDDANQGYSNSAALKFEEVVLMDGSLNIVWTALIEDDADGFTSTANETFDFQMILPESDVKVNPTTYYFYTEIGS